MERLQVVSPGHTGRPDLQSISNPTWPCGGGSADERYAHLGPIEVEQDEGCMALDLLYKVCKTNILKRHYTTCLQAGL